MTTTTMATTDMKNSTGGNATSASGRRRGRPSRTECETPPETIVRKAAVSKRFAAAEFGKRLYDLRSAAGWSQTQMGMLIKMSTSYVSRLESGEVQPTVGAAQRIATIFNLTLDQLLDNEPPSYESQFDPELQGILVELRGRKLSPGFMTVLKALVDVELSK